MKTSPVIIALTLLPSLCRATPAVNVPDSTMSAPVTFVGARSPHEQILDTVQWETNWLPRVSAVTDSLDQVTFQTNFVALVRAWTNQVTELAVGLNYRDATSGQWRRSRQEFQSAADGSFVANQGQHQLTLPATLSGSIRLTLPDGQTLVSEPSFLTFYGTTSGQSAMIAQINPNSAGQLISSNVVLYANAFDDLRGAIRYTYRQDGIEQDVILYENVTPADWGITNGGPFLLCMYTEFTQGPEPGVRNVQLPDGSQDEILNFGTMKMGANGRAFLWSDTDTGTPVQKSWQMIEQRTFLIESVQFDAAEQMLDSLPKGTAQRRIRPPVSSRSGLLAQLHNKPVGRPSGTASAQSGGKQPAFVLDYTIVNGTLSNYVFQSGSTYYLSGNVSVNGTNTTFEPATVLKYASGVSLTVNTPITWLGEMYRPVLMLAKDDNSAGNTISGSTGNPGNSYYAVDALYFNASTANSTLSLEHLRVANARIGVAINGKSGHVLRHVQMVTCGGGVSLTNTTASLQNALFDHVMTNFCGSSSTLDAEYLTSDTAAWLNNNIGTGLYVTNSLLVAVTNLGSYSSLDCVSTQSDRTGVFETVAAGSHYLPADSSLRTAGTTSIDPTLLAEIAKTTTYAPVLLTSAISVDTVLSPHVQRDTDGTQIGYHYDPLDYEWSALTVNSGKTLTLTNGVAVAYYGTTGMTAYGNVVSRGSPVRLNRIVGFQSVQEQRQANTSYLVYSTGGTGPNLDLRFTDLPLMGGQGYLLDVSDTSTAVNGVLTLQDCQVLGSQIYVALGYTGGGCGCCCGCGSYSDFGVNLINNVLDHCHFSLYRESNSGYGYTPSLFGLSAYNNLFREGYVTLYYSLNSSLDTSYTTLSWDLYDNLFGNVSLSSSGNGMDVYGHSGSYFYHDGYNGYVSTTHVINSSGNDKSPTVADYQSGALGRFYYPTTGGNLSQLIDAGSTTADLLGLYHYTTTTDQTVEGSGTVDIGFHYIAVDGNGNPLDYDGDGIPDYLEDSNGNGAVDSGETDWQTANEPGLTVLITRPRSGADLP